MFNMSQSFAKAFSQTQEQSFSCWWDDPFFHFLLRNQKDLRIPSSCCIAGWGKTVLSFYSCNVWGVWDHSEHILPCWRLHSAPIHIFKSVSGELNACCWAVNAVKCDWWRVDGHSASQFDSCCQHWCFDNWHVGIRLTAKFVPGS